MSIFDQGFGRDLYRGQQVLGGGLSADPTGTGGVVIGGGAVDSGSPTITSAITNGTPASQIISGALDSILFSKKTSFLFSYSGL